MSDANPAAVNKAAANKPAPDAPAADAPAPPKKPEIEARAPVERKVEPQKELSFQQHGWKQMHYDAIAAVGVRPEDVLKREYWSHVAQRSLRVMTKISIMAEDGSWYGEVVCFRTYSNGALVAFIHPPILIEKSGYTREESEYEVTNGGILKQWCVVRRTDGRVLSDNHADAGQAEMWLSSWLKAQGSRRAA